MKDFNLLFTCSSGHIAELIEVLRDNPDGAKIGIYTCNADYHRLPPRGFSDGDFVVPPMSDSDYVQNLHKLCEKNRIDIIIPTVTLELEYLAKRALQFYEKGVKVSVSSLDSLLVANNKIALQKAYPEYMPAQIVTRSWGDVLFFRSNLPKGTLLCCKLPDHAGGNGFAIVDDEKANDPAYFNRYATERYISTDQLRQLVLSYDKDVLIQEYKPGLDYSVCVLANRGEISHIVGYVGYVMSYGAIMSGEIQRNEAAYAIAEKIVRDLILDGNACFDFRIGPDGSVTLLEINPRVNASLPFIAKAGVNMAYIRCKNLLGDFSDWDKEDDIRYGLKMKKFYSTAYYE